MPIQLTNKTKENIQDFITNYIDDNIDFRNEEEINHVRELAVEELEDNFENVEFNYELLREYYNDNNEVENLSELKKLSCGYARSLI